MTDWNHPRRAAKETLSYLSQVEPVIDDFAEDDHSSTYGYSSKGGGGEDEDESDIGREQMLENVLDELEHQTASIMEDKHGSVVAEKIARRLTPLQLRIMLSRCRGYMLSLANNRYSSHVLQTLLSLVGQVVEAEISSPDLVTTISDTKNGNNHSERSMYKGKDQVDLMQDIVLSLVAELKGTWAELMDDISGSHTGRGFLQVLGGLPILSERRGKQSRHAHSVGTAIGTGKFGSIPGSGQIGSQGSPLAKVDPEAFERWSTPIKHRVPPSFEVALTDVTTEIVALPARELQTLACSTSGCPLFVMLLRVYANLAIEPASGRLPSLEQESTAMDLVTQILQWEHEDQSAEVVFAMSGERTASHFLEAVLWLSPLAFFQGLYRRCFESRLLEFCEHGVSNFLIQAALQRVEDSAMAEAIVGAIGDLASDLLKARRAGVLWRAAQACVRLSLNPRIQTNLLQNLAGAVCAGHTGVVAPPSRVGDGVHTEAKRTASENYTKASSASNDPFKSAREWVPALLSPRVPEKESGGGKGLDRLFLNVPGARIVQNALLFDPHVAAPVVKAVAALPEVVLAAVARDNIGSRCLLDPILDEAAGGETVVGSVHGDKGKGRNKPAEDARRTILRSFRGHLVAMACDRVGWHVLLKCFRGVDMKEKRAIVEELASGGEHAWLRMSGYPSGRSVLTECMVERFSRSPREWEDAFKSKENRAKILDDILAIGSSTKASRDDKTRGKGEQDEGKRDGNTRASEFPSPSPQERCDSGGGVDNEDGGDGAVGKGKRRRQRGRGKRGRSSAGEASDKGDDLKREDASKTAIDSENADSSVRVPPMVSRGKRKGASAVSAGKNDEAANVARGDSTPKREGVKKDAAGARKQSSLLKKARKLHESVGEDAPAAIEAEVISGSVREQSTRTGKNKKAKKMKAREKDLLTVANEDKRQVNVTSIDPGERRKKSPAEEGGKTGNGFQEKMKKKKRYAHNEEADEVVVKVSAAKEAPVRIGKRKKKASSKGGFRLF